MRGDRLYASEGGCRSTAVELRQKGSAAWLLPLPAERGEGRGEGSVLAPGVPRQENSLGPPLPSPLLPRGRRGRNRRVSRGNFLNSTGVGLGRGVSLVLARPSSPRPSPPLAGGEGEAAAPCAGTSLIQRQCPAGQPPLSGLLRPMQPKATSHPRCTLAM
jgi:hypothetical protein